MGLKGICRFLFHRLVEGFVVILVIIFLPQLPPYTSISQPFSVSPVKPFEGKLSLNEKLNDVEVWHKGDFHGPEAFADYNGELYTALYEGDIVKLTNNHIVPIVKTGKPCKGYYEERICGRPLGMQFDKYGSLYVADAYYGIFKVNVKTGEKSLLISVDQEIGGKKPKLPNSIALASNGDIFWSDSSSEFLLEDGVFDLLADPSGRLIHFDSRTKQNKVLIDKIHFANGVALSEDEEFVIVSETGRNRIHRYYLRGAKKGTHDIFIDGLPGIADNLKSDGKGGFFVPLLIPVDKDHPSLFQVVGPFPKLRKLFARLLGLTQTLFKLLNKVYPCEFGQKGVHFIGHFTSFTSLIPSGRVTVLHLDKFGNVVDSLHALNNKIASICEVHIFKDTLYLGSPFNDYIGKIPLSKIGWEHLAPERIKRDIPIKEQVPKVTQTPTTTTTTTTQRAATTSSTTVAPPTTVSSPTTTTTRTSPPQKQTTPPSKQQAPQQQQTTPPTTRQTPPAPQQQTRPTPSKQQATPSTSKQTTSSSPKQTAPPPIKQQTTPSPPQAQTPSPPPKQATALPPKQQTTPPPPKQQTTSSSRQQTTPPKQSTNQPASPPPTQQAPGAKQGTTPSSVPKQQVPSPRQQTPPPSQPPSKESAPPVAQPIRDQPKSIPIKDSVKAA